jgi:hypothetical protein
MPSLSLVLLLLYTKGKSCWKWKENVEVTGIRDKDKKKWRNQQNKREKYGREKIIIKSAEYHIELCGRSCVSGGETGALTGKGSPAQKLCWTYLQL